MKTFEVEAGKHLKGNRNDEYWNMVNESSVDQGLQDRKFGNAMNIDTI